MGRWLQQGVFAERVKDYCRKNGLLTSRGAVKLDVLGDLFNLHEDTVRQLLQNKGRVQPGLKTLRRICKVLGVSVTEFIDAPTDPPPCLTHERWAGLSERDRALVSEMVADITESTLSFEEREEIYRIFREVKDRILRLKRIWTGR